MTVSRQTFGFMAECDHCSHTEDFDNADSFQEAIDEMKETGWRITKVKGEWDHTCPICVAKEIEDLK